MNDPTHPQPSPWRGAAFLDASRRVLCADEGFLSALGLDAAAPAEALAARAAGEPALERLLAGAGGGWAELPGPGGDPLRLERRAAPGGALLLLRGLRDGERLERAGLALGLARLAGGLGHDVRNLLNGMALQLALLEGTLGEPGVAAVSRHLTALRGQVGKLGEVVTRFADVADPAAPEAPLDVADALDGLVILFGHEVRQRHATLELTAHPGLTLTAAPTSRALALLLGLLARAVAEVEEGGVLLVRTAGAAGAVSVTLAHPVGAERPDLGYDTGAAVAAARALGGTLVRQVSDGRAQVSLELPGVERA